MRQYVHRRYSFPLRTYHKILNDKRLLAFLRIKGLNINGSPYIPLDHLETFVQLGRPSQYSSSSLYRPNVFLQVTVDNQSDFFKVLQRRKLSDFSLPVDTVQNVSEMAQTIFTHVIQYHAMFYPAEIGQLFCHNYTHHQIVDR